MTVVNSESFLPPIQNNSGRKRDFYSSTIFQNQIVENNSNINHQKNSYLSRLIRLSNISNTVPLNQINFVENEKNLKTENELIEHEITSVKETDKHTNFPSKLPVPIGLGSRKRNQWLEPNKKKEEIASEIRETLRHSYSPILEELKVGDKVQESHETYEELLETGYSGEMIDAKIETTNFDVEDKKKIEFKLKSLSECEKPSSAGSIICEYSNESYSTEILSGFDSLKMSIDTFIKPKFDFSLSSDQGINNERNLSVERGIEDIRPSSSYSFVIDSNPPRNQSRLSNIMNRRKTWIADFKKQAKTKNENQESVTTNCLNVKCVSDAEIQTSQNELFSFNDIRDGSVTIPNNFIYQTILNYLQDQGLHESAQIFSLETGVVSNKENEIELKRLMRDKNFDEAIRLTCLSVLSSKTVQLKKESTIQKLNISFHDFIYILYKYYFIDSLKTGAKNIAWEVLLNLRDFVENKDKEDRYKWYESDINHLESAFNSDRENAPNWLLNWDWDTEMHRFWNKVEYVYRFRRMKKILFELKSLYSSNILDRFKMENSEKSVPLFAHVAAEYFMDVRSSISIKDLFMLGKRVLKSDIKLLHTLCPDIPTNAFNDEFFWISWPVWDGKYSTALDQKKNHIDNRIILLQRQKRLNYIAGASDDKKISIYDLQFDHIQTLDPIPQSKTIIFLKFHPENFNWVISVDTDRNIVWWQLDLRQPLQIWRKSHSHTVNHFDFVPNEKDSRAVTCSADHSIKFWHFSTSKSHAASIHSNAPFTTFCISGKEGSQLLYAAQPKGIIKIYKVKTLNLIKQCQVIPFIETSLCSICVSPLDENLIIISADRSEMIILFNIKREKVRFNPVRINPEGTIYQKSVLVLDYIQLNRLKIS
ncbi:hypothetical protein O9G_000565 [Rozella allomycis CSF55]|uniref:WD40 repeat-like protein n=1 Tax=Rozella allomycis (strain CSF55) TaxID=988480 RepID=A0A075AVM5_ROZAC|nr:hypothetical protein O9G_000565 [Rozella allomycis CSF55]|eukprot:EPZ34378.1 hypothetical protein O9G_000565 [Rozella allomycis CSF55]